MNNTNITLQNIAFANLKDVLKNEKNLIIVDHNEKISNAVLRTFVNNEISSGVDLSIIIELLLNLDATVEIGNIRQYLSKHKNGI